jgi:outer membrane protein assembly factor BamA
LFNLKLFRAVDCTIDTLALPLIHLQFVLQEDVYIGLAPNATLADRNFNVWHQDYHADLWRVNYILKTTFKNLQGLNRTLQTTVQLGFNNAATLRYTLPNIGAKQNNKITFGLDYLNTKQFHHQIINNKQQFFKNDNDFILNKIHAEIMFTKRLQFYKNITASTNWTYLDLAADLYQSNSRLLPRQLQRMHYFQINLQYDYNNVDNVYYPLKGWHATITSANKFGFGVQQFNQHFIYTSLLRHQPLPYKLYGTWVLRCRAMLQNTDAFYFNRAMGFANDYVRGYEYFVMNGSHFVINRLDLKRKLLQININKKQRFWAPEIPIEFYPKIYSDAGMVKSINDGNTSNLRNTFLYSTGAGLDVKFGNYAVVRLEYSMNHLKQKGLFLHLTSL